AGDDDEAFALRQAIAQIRQRLAMRRALEIEMRVRRELERSALQSIELIVHLIVSIRPVAIVTGNPLKAVTQAKLAHGGDDRVEIVSLRAIDTKGRRCRQAAGN